MSNDYYEQSVTFARGTVARSEEINQELTAIEEGFTLLPSPSAVRGGSFCHASDTGTANAYVVTVSGGPSTPTTGTHVSFFAGATNTGASTLKYGGWDPKALRRPDGSAVVAADIVAGTLYSARYQGSYWALESIPIAQLAEIAENAAGAVVGGLPSPIGEDGKQLEVIGTTPTYVQRTITAGTGLTGGGALTSNPTVAVDFASQAEAQAGTSTTKVLSPARALDLNRSLDRWTQTGTTQTIGTAVASVDFTSIPQTWADLMLVGTGVSHNNGSTTGFQVLFSSNNGSSWTVAAAITMANIAAADTSNLWMTLAQYSTANLKALLAGYGGSALAASGGTTGHSGFVSGSAINAIRISSAAGSLDAGSFSLYLR